MRHHIGLGAFGIALFATTIANEDMFQFKNASNHVVWVWIQEDGATDYRKPPIRVFRGETRPINVDKLERCYLVVGDNDRNFDHIGYLSRDGLGTPQYVFNMNYYVVYKPVFETKTKPDSSGRERTYTVQHFVPEKRVKDNSSARGLMIQKPAK